MKLMTKELWRRLPELGGQDSLGGEAIAYAKLFTPDSSWSWFVTEGSQEEQLLFGLVDGHVRELGYFSLKEMEMVRGPMGLPIERDLHWKPKRLREIAPEMFLD